MSAAICFTLPARPMMTNRFSPTQMIRINGIDMAYDSFGNAGAPAILLIAGLGTQMIRWTEPFCRTLAGRGFRVIRFDNRDSGPSTHFQPRACTRFQRHDGW